jgi:Cu/Ag efflux protein CusF
MASMPGMDHSGMDHGAMDRAGAQPAAKPSAPAAGHGTMDHGSMPGMSQSPANAEPQVAQAAHVQGSGTVNSVDAAGHKINLSHSAIPAIGWPAMTMDFMVAPSVDLRTIKPGSRVNFMMERGGDGMYVVHALSPAGGGQ